jgi:hypothetical protein
MINRKLHRIHILLRHKASSGDNGFSTTTSFNSSDCFLITSGSGTGKTWLDDAPGDGVGHTLRDSLESLYLVVGQGKLNSHCKIEQFFIFSSLESDSITWVLSEVSRRSSKQVIGCNLSRPLIVE